MAGKERRQHILFFLLTLITRQSLEFFLLGLSLAGGHIGVIDGLNGPEREMGWSNGKRN